MSDHDTAATRRLRDTVSRRTLTVGIFIFDEVEVLDFAGPFEVFSVAGRIARANGFSAHVPFKVCTVSAARGPVTARHGLTVAAHRDFASGSTYDILIVPGGVVDRERSKAEVIDWIRSTAQTALLTASVCTGAFLLAEAGLLDGHRATTHWEDIAAFRNDFPHIPVIESVAYVDEGEILSSAGISAGIGMSLHIVERILGRQAATRTARQMQYDWP